jgi:hypothetical protein
MIGRRNKVWHATVKEEGNFGVLLQSPCQGCFICPLDVAGLGWRYLMTAFVVRCGPPWRKTWQMAAGKDDLGGLHRL